MVRMLLKRNYRCIKCNYSITREGLRAFAYRIDGQQVQINQVISHLEQMMRDINSSTENIQHSRTGW